jgi:hypothetical protein
MQNRVGIGAIAVIGIPKAVFPVLAKNRNGDEENGKKY